MTGKKIGIMGGTFDPIHIAHLRLAETAHDLFHLDQVIFLPASDPPHKAGQRITGYEKRAEMVKAAIENNPHFICSDLERMRNGFSYTSETLEWFFSENPENAYYFIVGADSLFYMEEWREPEKIFRLATILAAVRGGISESQLLEKIRFLTGKYHGNIYPLKYVNLDISSRLIRELTAAGHSIRYYVPDQVLKYIHENKLYADSTGNGQ